jgi:hypothetical protein
VQPTPNSVYIDPLLSEMAVAFMQDAAQFISGKVFPAVPVQYQTGKYDYYDRDAWYSIRAKPRAPGEESAGGGYTLEQKTYAIIPYAIHSDLDGQTAANAMPPEDPRRNKTRWCTAQLLLLKEKLWSDGFFTAGVWGTDMTGVSGTSPTAGQFTQWSNHTSSTPIEDVETQVTAMEQLTGYAPNTMVIGRQTWAGLKNHPQFIDRIKYTQRGILTEELLAAVFGLDQVLVSRATVDTVPESNAIPPTGASYSFLMGKGALLCYSAPAPSIEMPSAGYHFTWTGYLGASAAGSVVYEIPAPLRKATRIEGELAVSPTIVAKDLGCFFASAVA